MDLTSPASLPQTDGPVGWFQTCLGRGGGVGYHVDPAQTIENGRGGIPVTHRGRGHKVR